MVLVLLAGQFVSDPAIVGWLAVAAAILNGLRLAGWRTWRVRDQPILWILHVGYAWLVVGLAFRGWALLGTGIDEAAALHVLSVGAIGSMTLGVMTRAGLGHTGRPVEAAPAITAAYLLLSLTTVVRVGGPILAPDYAQAALVAHRSADQRDAHDEQNAEHAYHEHRHGTVHGPPFSQMTISEKELYHTSNDRSVRNTPDDWNGDRGTLGGPEVARVVHLPRQVNAPPGVAQRPALLATPTRWWRVVWRRRRRRLG